MREPKRGGKLGILKKDQTLVTNSVRTVKERKTSPNISALIRSKGV